MSIQIKGQTKVSMSRSSETGFTLIELMISIVLGLLLVAATSQLFISGVVSSRLQQGGADVQDNGLFGLDYLAKDVRLANYGNSTANLILNEQTPWGGVVLTTTNLSVTPAIAAPLLSHSGGDTTGAGNQWTGVSGVNQKSDQLTIQFQAPFAMSNCEGQAVLASDLIVERYFLRQDASGATTDLVLACDANTPSVGAANKQPVSVTGLGDAGQVILNRVDQFHVLLGARDTSGNMGYYTIRQYNAKAAAARLAAAVPPQIVSIQVAALVRSADNTNSTSINLLKKYPILDQSVTLNTVAAPNSNRYIRQVYATTVALRNGLGG